MNKQKPLDMQSYGGQAVIEGVMMKSNSAMAVAVRRPDKKIAVLIEPLKSQSSRPKVLKWPFVRGVVALKEVLILGTKALNYSAKQAEGEDEPKKTSSKKNKHSKTEIKTDSFDSKTGWEIFLTLAVSLLLGILIFKLLPYFLTQTVSNLLPVLKTGILFNFLEGIFKITIFIIYILLISRLNEVKTLFKYHGAEHKSIACYESGYKLTVKNAKKFSPIHRRCGTTFLFLVIMLSILFYTFIPASLPFWTKFAWRILLLPVIAGFSYEILKLGAKIQNSFTLNLFVQPGLWIQKLTTAEPNDKQLEVAIAALKAVIDAERKSK